MPRKLCHVIRRQKSTSTDVAGDMDVLKKIYEEMKKIQKEQEEMKVLVKAGLHGVRRELRFLQEVIDEDWKEKSDTETEMESNIEEVDWYKEEKELRQKGKQPNS